MWAEVSFILSQFTHLTEEQTDGHFAHGSYDSCSVVKISVRTGAGPGTEPLQSNIVPVWSQNIFWSRLCPSKHIICARYVV